MNQTKKCETKDSSLRINFVLEPRDQRFPGSLSLSRSAGRVGENPGNEVEKIREINLGILATVRLIEGVRLIQVSLCISV